MISPRRFDGRHNDVLSIGELITELFPDCIGQPTSDPIEPCDEYARTGEHGCDCEDIPPHLSGCPAQHDSPNWRLSVEGAGGESLGQRAASANLRAGVVSRAGIMLLADLLAA